MITSKEHIIEYFNSGIKDKKNFKIGIEHEKFLLRMGYDKNKKPLPPKTEHNLISLP